MAKSEIFVVAFKSESSIKYAGLDSRGFLSKSESPVGFKSYFSHEQATALVKALRAKGLGEGVEVRARSLAQCVRDYSYQMLLKSKEVKTTNAELMERVIARYPAKKVEAEPAKAEEPKAEVAEKQVEAVTE